MPSLGHVFGVLEHVRTRLRSGERLASCLDTALSALGVGVSFTPHCRHKLTGVTPQSEKTKFTTTMAANANQSRRDWIFDLIFKDHVWMEAVHNVTIEPDKRPAVSLVGYDLIQAYNDSKLPSFLALFISDWSGDARDLKETLFLSFREQDFVFDNPSAEVTFKKSGLVLYIGDAIHSYEWIRMRDPSRLFGFHNGQPQTAVLYFEHLATEEKALGIIGADMIGGLIDFSGKEYLNHMCSIPMHFGSGRRTPITRCIQTFEIPHKVVSLKRRGTSHYTDGYTFSTHWRLAQGKERRWSIVDS